MKKILLRKKGFWSILGVTAVVLVFLIYWIVRPISYGMEYYWYEICEEYEFEATMVFHMDDKVTIVNSNFDEPLEEYYYYKDGWTFLCMAQTEEEYKAEIEQINGDWEAAINTPFYASKINAFSYNNDNPLDGTQAAYVCKTAKVVAVVCGIIEGVLIAVTVLMLVMRKKTAN